jgi:hypothetical protein
MLVSNLWRKVRLEKVTIRQPFKKLKGQAIPVHTTTPCFPCIHFNITGAEGDQIDGRAEWRHFLYVLTVTENTESAVVTIS